MYGHLTVICGPMFAGKTTELLKRILWARNGQSKAVLVVKPAFDKRYSATKIVSHSGLSVEAKAITAWEDVDLIAADADLVCIDEVQFFVSPHYESDIIENIRQMLCVGTDVVVTGLDMDWKGAPFQTTATLAAMADTLLKISANCSHCGQAATKTFKKSSSNDQIELGASDLYEARCNDHW